MNALQQVLKDAQLDTIATVLVAVMFGWKANLDATPEEAPERTKLDFVRFTYGDPMQLTVKQLREIASGLSIRGCWKMRKAELCVALEAESAGDLDPDDFNVVESEDREVERFRTYTHTRTFFEEDEHGFPELKREAETVTVPTWVWNNQPYHTFSGHNPVVEDLHAIADQERTAAGFYSDQICDLPGEPFTSESKAWPRSRWVPQERMCHRWLRAIHRCKTKQQAQRCWKSFWSAYFRNKKAETLTEWLWQQHRQMILSLFASQWKLKPKGRN
jgi:hypothetical protein